jgi:NAD(P)H-quinone oxidoreductase subunit 5
MDGPERETVGELERGRRDPTDRLARTLTGVAWTLWVASLAVLGVVWSGGGPVDVGSWLRIDGLTVAMWSVVAFFSAIVHTYSLRYLAGNDGRSRFFAGLTGFAAAVGLLVAADHVALFAGAWLAMGLVVAELIGHARNWDHARRAAGLARRSFAASSLLVAAGLGLLAWAAGTTQLSTILAGLGSLPTWTLATAGILLGLGAVVQSALAPFHGWLLTSMTAPTPASALMHAGFVNAGGLLLARTAPVFVREPLLLAGLAVVGAASALLGKAWKAVQPDLKRRLGCSTVAQMGFMVLQAGLGLFAAAVTHLVLHGFYKAYRFLASGTGIERRVPDVEAETSPLGVAGLGVVVFTGAAGAGLFALLTGKGLHLDGGLLLAGLVALTGVHSARQVARRANLRGSWRYGALPLIGLPAVALYAGAYQLVRVLLADVPATTSPVELTFVHGALAVAFLGTYVVLETGIHRRSRRLYTWLFNAAQPDPDTVLTSREDYDDH